MVHNKEEARKIISKQIKGVVKRADYISLASKISSEYKVGNYKFVDDFDGMSEEDRLKYWGIAQ